MIGTKPTKAATKKRKRRHMQRLRRTFRWVMKRGSGSLWYAMSAAITNERGMGGRPLLQFASAVHQFGWYNRGSVRRLMTAARISRQFPYPGNLSKRYQARPQQPTFKRSGGVQTAVFSPASRDFIEGTLRGTSKFADIAG